MTTESGESGGKTEQDISTGEEKIPAQEARGTQSGDSEDKPSQDEGIQSGGTEEPSTLEEGTQSGATEETPPSDEAVADHEGEKVDTKKEEAVPSGQEPEAGGDAQTEVQLSEEVCVHSSHTIDSV